MPRFSILTITLALLLVFSLTATAAEPDPVLHQKAMNYIDYIQTWASNGFGPYDEWDSLGGVCEQMYTDETLTELERLRGSGDSTIWSGMYTASQALRYLSTGDEAAREEVRRMATYLHLVKDVTQTPGFVARFVALDEEPWNREYGVDHPHKVLGEGEYAGYYWVDDTSRDQYTGWWLGMSMAYEALDDEEIRAMIRADLKDVIDTLKENRWLIYDQNGVAHGNGAAKVLPSMQLSWVLQAAACDADPTYWDLFYELLDKYWSYLWLDTFSWLNTYGQYYGFNLSHNTFLPLFRLTPDRASLEHLWKIWTFNVRKWTEWTHNAWFDAVYLAGCHRLGTCDPEEVEGIAADVNNTLTLFHDAPNQAFTGDPPDLPLDQFSVFMSNLEDMFPFLEDLFGIDERTRDPHDFADRCWSDMIWQRSPYHISCNTEPANRVGPGMDYSIAYWMAYYYGIVPGDGPYDDDDPTDDDDDTAPDDDTSDDDDDDDDDSTPDDDAIDDDSSDDDAIDDDDNDNDDDGCGC